jgi:ABC-type phosphate transport system auxiliary subunit
MWRAPAWSHARDRAATVSRYPSTDPYDPVWRTAVPVLVSVLALLGVAVVVAWAVRAALGVGLLLVAPH